MPEDRCEVQDLESQSRGDVNLFPFLSRPSASTLLSHSFFKQVQ
jgi:hypothetical protein